MQQYRLKFDIHTHTTFSHGKGSIEDNVKVALQKGLKTIGISDHGPGHISYGIKRSAVPIMRAEIEVLRKKYPQIEILLGVEANIMNPSGHLDVLPHEFEQYDYILAGYHYGIFGEKPLRAGLLHSFNYVREHTGISVKAAKHWNTEMTIKALYENPIKVLTHPGDKGEFDIAEIAKACAERKTWMEISNWHKDLTVESIRIAAKEEVQFILSSDAHVPHNVGGFEGGLKRAIEAGLDLERIVNLEYQDV
ncbi:PHP domain-containing protein [Sinanaerobacter sp. ZZT-01]|uniref:PHP domain-containing protein n=1 Tax=Sinanaerobacter sp. ZZT-01 TaxID=3111540 RepID=UPI002D79D432|nr:PHP domain-containing protein [Sinanaerobacter sp. ZZT-01]WRR94290.1 PHP domain-containing protein [Sinanaerobacter sp. ZZT-01]